jgi:hypothetical protein
MSRSRGTEFVAAVFAPRAVAFDLAFILSYHTEIVHEWD